MDKHKIELAELQEWKEKHRVLIASSEEFNKRLYCTLNGTYELEHNGSIVWRGMQDFSATEEYNKI